MVRADVIASKVARAVARLEGAEALLLRSAEEYVADLTGRDLAAFYLFLAIQECIDIATHWVADEGWTPPDDVGGSFDLLADHSIIDRDTAAGMRAANGLRNRIAHGYALLDHARLHAESSEGLGVVRQFLASVADAAARLPRP